MWTPNQATLRLQAIKARKSSREPETKKADTETKGKKSETKPAKSDKKKLQPVKKKSKPIKARNKKQAQIIRQLKKAYPVFLAAHPECEIKSPVCTFHATVVNHNRGRGANVLNQDDWCPCCPPCNGYIEEHHAWAEERGFKARRHGPKK